MCVRDRRPVMLLVLAIMLGAAGAAAPQEAAPAPAASPLTVEEAVRLALANPTVRLAQQDLQVAQAQLTAARAGSRPDLNVVGTGVYTPSVSTISIPGAEGEFQIGTRFSTSAQLTASKAVWPPAQWEAPIGIAHANVSLREQNLARTRQQVAFQTRQAFFQLLSARELLDVAADAVQVARGQLELARTTVAAGVAAPLDISQAEAVLADAEVNQARAENGVDIARAALATQLGLPAGAPVDISPPQALPTAPTDIDGLTQQALAQRPEMAQLDARRQQLRANIELIRLEKLPIVNLQATYNQRLTGGTVFGTSGLTVTAVAALNLYNGGQTTAELEAARTQLAQVDTTARQLELGITFEVRQASLNLENALKQIPAADKQLTAATEALRISRIRYEAGEGILLEVDQARLRQTQARTSLAEARFQAQVAAAQLALALGLPVEG